MSKSEWKEIIQTAVNFATEVCLSYENYVSFEFVKRLKSTKDNNDKY